MRATLLHIGRYDDPKADADHWARSQGAIIALQRFAKFTIKNIREGKLMLSGDERLVQEWHDLKAKLETLVLVGNSNSNILMV
jgi:hypothetical protein